MHWLALLTRGSALPAVAASCVCWAAADNLQLATTLQDSLPLPQGSEHFPVSLTQAILQPAAAIAVTAACACTWLYMCDQTCTFLAHKQMRLSEQKELKLHIRT